MGKHPIGPDIPPAGNPDDIASLDEALVVAVESESFAVFDAWIDADLARLESRWGHMASPRAKRASVWLHRDGR
jgi:hypothetical protein